MADAVSPGTFDIVEMVEKTSLLGVMIEVKNLRMMGERTRHCSQALLQCRADIVGNVLCVEVNTRHNR